MRHNLGLKIFSLGLAIIIWFQLTLMAEHNSRIALPLELTNKTESDTLVNDPEKIICLVQGRGIDILKLRFSRAYIKMDEAAFKTGNENEFETDNVPEHLALAILSVDPANVIQKRKLSSNLMVEDKRSVSLAEKRRLSKALANEKNRPQTSIADPVISHILTDVPISVAPGQKIFPTTVSLKVKAKTSLIAALPQGVTVRMAANPDARGMYSLSASFPDGVVLLDMTPKQVHLDR